MMPRANFSDLLKSSALARCRCRKEVVAICNEDVSLHAHKGPDFVVDLDLLWSGDNPLVNDRKFCRRGQRKVDVVMEDATTTKNSRERPNDSIVNRETVDSSMEFGQFATFGYSYKMSTHKGI